MPSEEEVTLIDGYTVLFRLAKLEPPSKDNPIDYQLRIEREYFLSLLQKRIHQPCIVVFDGQGNIQVEKRKNLWIIFSGEEETADDIIVRLLNRQVVKGIRFDISQAEVITEDKGLQDRLKQLHSSSIRIGSLEMKAFSH